ncbi:hypothetical protein SELMODRAFT_404532 [Selaginella moellendorffii]|uniref:F-box domain-containing protein n=1 Tax=Selaginella moellendorffii TaxID=88036 RepID=D8QVM8_SELML|nr:hypothetical protein SELMODRAFT_404532 [Selaginella moellendorffii]
MDILVHIVEEEVLTRLPAVVLHRRVRAVCKRWRDLIDSPRFAKFHSAHHSIKKQSCPPRVLGITQNGKELYSCNPFVAGSDAQKDWVRQDVYGHIRVVKACGGLLFGKMGRDYVALNPLTRALKVLPPPPLEAAYISPNIHCALVLEPSMQRYWICIAGDIAKQLHVYHSRSGVWDTVDYLPGWGNLKYGVGMANSNAYFSAEHDCMWGILSFNMEEMRWFVEWSSFKDNSPIQMCWSIYKWMVTTANQFFMVAMGEDQMTLIRLDCASNGHVQEAGCDYNEKRYPIPPICFYEGTFMIADEEKLYFLDYESCTFAATSQP